MKKAVKNQPACGLYGVGLIGALVYFVSHADSLTSGLIGVVKAIVWPAFLVFQMFEFLGIK